MLVIIFEHFETSNDGNLWQLVNMICECTKTWQQNQEGSPVLTFEIDCQDLHFLEKNVKNNTYGEFFF